MQFREAFLPTNFQNPVLIWEPDPSVTRRGVLHLLHGMSEYLQRYDHFARFLARHGFVVIGQNLDGHGPAFEDSLGDVHPSQWTEWIAQIKAVYNWIQKEYSDLEYSLMGHSLGTFLSEYFLRDNPQIHPKLLVLSAPVSANPFLLAFGWLVARTCRLMGLNKKAGKFIKLLTFANKNRRFKGNSGYEWISNDPMVVTSYVMDPLCGFSGPCTYYEVIFGGIFKLLQKRKSMSLHPNHILILGGLDDPLGQYGKTARKLTQQLENEGQKVDAQFLPRVRHEPIQSIQKTRIYDIILRALNSN